MYYHTLLRTRVGYLCQLSPIKDQSNQSYYVAGLSTEQDHSFYVKMVKVL